MSDVMLCLAAGLMSVLGLCVARWATRDEWRRLWWDICDGEPEGLLTIVFLLAVLLAASGLIARAVGAVWR